MIHGASAVNEESLFRGASVGAVPLAAVTLVAILWQSFKLQDWALVAFGGVATLQEVEGVVVVETTGAWAAGKVATASEVAVILWTPFFTLLDPVGHHIQALFFRAAALQALVPAPLTAHV